jgi:GAF domain-containing protein/HAMP domain-containing protein
LIETPTRQAFAHVYQTGINSGVAVVVSLVLASLLGLYIVRSVVQPLRHLQEGAATIGGGDLEHRIDIQTSDEIGELATAFNGMATQLREMVGSLEQRVADRTRGLQTAAEVARATTAVLDRDQLLRRVVDLVRERFNLYYVGLFLVEGEPGSGRESAVLRAGTGAAGRQMMAQGHKLEVGGDSMIGQCVAGAEARIALDVGAEPVHFDNPFLPETRSEMALPLRSRGRAVGAMTVQSTAEAAFDETDIAVMQTVADQVAVALDNARLFAEAQAALAEMESIHQRYLGQAWAKYTVRQTVTGYKKTRDEARFLTDETLSEVQQAVARREPLLRSNGGDKQTDEPSTLVVPVKLRGQPIGALGFKDEEGRRRWTDEDVTLAEAIAEQLALAADNLRLLDETQRRAARERTISKVSARMRETLDIETMLKAASNEMRQALGLDDLVIRLTTTETGDD